MRRPKRFGSSWGREGAVSSRQSGDLEGLSRSERADSESVEELVEEGNVFEAGAVAGVEEADGQDTGKCTPMRSLRTTFPMSTWTRTRPNRPGAPGFSVQLGTIEAEKECLSSEAYLVTP